MSTGDTPGWSQMPRCDRDREEGMGGAGFKPLSSCPALLPAGNPQSQAARLAAEHGRPQECRAPKIYG